MDSVKEPESTLKPPPWTFISTRCALPAGMASGVTTRTGIPAIMDWLMFTGYRESAFVAAPDCHASTFARATASVSVSATSGNGWANASCASGLTVVGTGTTRVT